MAIHDTGITVPPFQSDGLKVNVHAEKEREKKEEIRKNLSKYGSRRITVGDRSIPFISESLTNMLQAGVLQCIKLEMKVLSGGSNMFPRALSLPPIDLIKDQRSLYQFQRENGGARGERRQLQAESDGGGEEVDL